MYTVMLKNKPLMLLHSIAAFPRPSEKRWAELAKLAKLAFQQYEELQIENERLRKEIKAARNAILYPMTDLA